MIIEDKLFKLIVLEGLKVLKYDENKYVESVSNSGDSWEIKLSQHKRKTLKEYKEHRENNW